MIDTDLELDVALALARAFDACPDPDCRCVDTLRGLDRAGCPIHDPDPAPSTRGAVCPSCGHAVSDHRPGFGCIEPLPADDGETWEGCPCDVGAGGAA